MTVGESESGELHIDDEVADGREVEVFAAPVFWSGESTAARVVADRGLAINRLPGDETLDPFLRLAAAFLADYAGHSRRAYQADLQTWASWCHQLGVEK